MAFAVAACGGDDDDNGGPKTGGSAGQEEGGSGTTGGRHTGGRNTGGSAQGGDENTGGRTTQGGDESTGGRTTPGGSENTGGRTTPGGSENTGGVGNTGGGTPITGGTSGSGGAAGGAPGTGGGGGTGDECVDAGYEWCEEWFACWEDTSEQGISDFHAVHGTLELCKQNVDYGCAVGEIGPTRELIVEDKEACYGTSLTGCDKYRSVELLDVLPSKYDDPERNPACKPVPSSQAQGEIGDMKCIVDSDCPADTAGEPMYCFGEVNLLCEEYGECMPRIPAHSDATSTDYPFPSEDYAVIDAAEAPIKALYDPCQWGTMLVAAFEDRESRDIQYGEINGIAEGDEGDGRYDVWCQEVVFGTEGDDCAMSPITGSSRYGTDMQCEYGFYCSEDRKCEPDVEGGNEYLLEGDVCERDGEELGACVGDLACVPATRGPGITTEKSFCIPSAIYGDVGDLCGPDPVDIEFEEGDYTISLNVTCHGHTYCPDSSSVSSRCAVKGGPGDNCQRDDQCWEGLECDVTECAYPDPATCD